MDTFGCTPKYLAENGRAARAMMQSYFQALEMIAKEPQKSYEIMGADVKQKGEQFANSAKYLRWQDRAANQKFFAGELQAFLKEAGQILLEIGIIKSMPDVNSTIDTSYTGKKLTPAGRPGRAGRARRGFLRPLLRRLGGHARRLRLADLPRRSRHHGARGLELLVQHGFIKDILITIWRVFGGFSSPRRSASRSGWRWARTSRSRPSSSRSSRSRATCRLRRSFRCSSSGRNRRGAEAARHLRRLVLPDRADGGDTVGNTRRDLVEAAYTLGASDRGIVTRVLLLAAAPEIAEISRLVLGWAWTYVIVAELIGASSGIGHMIMDSQALLNTGQIIFGIVVIGVIGLVSTTSSRRSTGGSFPGASREQARRSRAYQSFAATRALERIDLAIADNDFLCILGPSAAASRRSCASSPGSKHRAPGACCSTASGRAPRARPRHGVPVLHAFPG